jgi:tetratricopeptide (TPR) repeat protein
MPSIIAVLLWQLGRALSVTPWAAGSAALLFALHPAGAEVVAWVTERKTLLAAAFMLGALLAYLRAEGRSGGRWAALSIVLFTLGALGKVAVAPFPFLLLALHRARSLRVTGPRLFVGVASLGVAMAAGIGVLHAHAAEKAGHTFFGGSPFVHIRLLAVTFGRYVSKLLFPTQLSPYYDFTARDLGVAAVGWGGLLAVAALTGTIWLLRRRDGWAFWAASALLLWLPSAGVIVPISTAMADRYLYLPLLFLAPLVALAVERWARPGRRRPATLLGMAILALLALLTVRQSTTWRSSLHLWSRAVEVQPENPWVRQKLAYTYWKEGRAPEALPHARVAVSHHPHWLEGWETLGQVALAADDLETAEGAFRQQLGLAPKAVNAFVGIARSREAQGDPRGAFEAYLQALDLKRDHRRAAERVAGLAQEHGWREEALASLPRSPTSVWIEIARGDLLASLGRREEAIRLWRRVLQTRPGLRAVRDRLERLEK